MDLLKLEEVDGLGERLTASALSKKLCIEIDEPWAGDTVSGIGRTSSITLTKQQAIELAEALMRWGRSSD